VRPDAREWASLNLIIPCAILCRIDPFVIEAGKNKLTEEPNSRLIIQGAYLSVMFAQSNPQPAPRQKALLIASLTLHGLLLAWLLYPVEPRLLNPVSVARGENGNVVTQLYWPSRTPDDSASSSSDSATEKYRRQRLAHAKLIWKQNTAAARAAAVALSPSEDKSNSQTLSSAGHGAPAGLPYGTLSNGATFGEEVRPALPVQTVDPVTYPWELPDSEGNVVVEITIDERGEIVKKAVLQSMGSKLDEKALAALDGWRFHPATRNGVAIASKQDAVFHFRRRG
jgi:TonB family protein